MRNLKTWMLSLLALGIFTVANAHVDPNKEHARPNNRDNNTVNFREDCDNAVLQIDQAINNVRARLTTGGDVWWDGNDGRYVVPKVPAGVPEVSSIFAGAVWLGGLDPAGNLKVAAQTYGRAGGNFDFFTGPIDPDDGTTEQSVCANWDRFFRVLGTEIDEHLRNFQKAQSEGAPYDPALIPKNVRGWPARGNEYFFDVHGFELPNTSQGLAGFFDENGDGNYQPEEGDYPVIEIRGCDAPQYPDEMIFWIYNDAGNIHAESQGDPIQMEVQVQAFSYATNDQINDMTFQRYKLINRAIESIDSMHFAMWVDADLGCYTDDYVGCDTLRSLAYIYNEDAIDGTTGCACDAGVNTYCDEVPIVGVDYFRGPLDEFGEELGMSSFTYFNNGGVQPAPPPGTTDPNNAQEFFNYLTGSWRDGNPFTYGDDAYQDGELIRYAFTEAPDDQNGWSMCTAGLPPGDRRTVQASGPFRLDPGAVNELIIGVVWIADQNYPCPSIRKLQEADDISQALFNNCFDITDGPDAPDVDFIELDQEIIAVFTNDELTSNNAFEEYEAVGLEIPALASDTTYNFEGYKLYQLSGPEVTIADLDDVDKARLIYQVDVKNGIGNVYNWSSVDSPVDFEVYTPTLEVEGQDQGIRHTFKITTDQFADEDARLVNHKKYYFTAIAYAHNEYEQFDPREVIGQRTPYLEGRKNIGDGTNPFYTVIPRPIVDRNLNANYGDGAIITRIDGIGNGGLSLDLSDETRKAIEDGSFNGEITYRPGRGPIEVAIFNPLDVRDGEFELTFVDDDVSDDKLEDNTGWRLTNLSDPSADVIQSDKSIENLNEQIIKEFGFSITVGQTADAGDLVDETNGAIGYEEEYVADDATPWVTGIPDGLSPGVSFFDDFIFDYVVTGPGQEDEVLDPDQGLSNIGPGYFTPYMLTSIEPKNEQNPPFITPAWFSSNNGHEIVRNSDEADLANLNNVDIVLTADKSLWSRCVVVETANQFYEQGGFITEGDAKMMDVRQSPNVTKYDNDGDGLPDVDGDDSGVGMGWFPGYAVDVETGERLNIFFGENSTYDGSFFPENYTSTPNGRDMMYNPSNQVSLGLGGFGGFYEYIAGGQHFIYVTKTPYDECALFRDRLDGSGSSLRKVRALREVTWAGFLLPLPGQSMLPYGSGETGLIPEDVVLKLRVDNPYQIAVGTGEFNGYPTYRFKLEGKQATEQNQVEIESALDMINVVPNPYYGFSSYETSQFDTKVLITNLPAKCVVTIYSLDGKFIRQYNRDEQGSVPVGDNRAIDRAQFIDFQEWDLRNNKGIPVASGVYLIHVDAEGLGERVIKWFGVGRQFDPSGL